MSNLQDQLAQIDVNHKQLISDRDNVVFSIILTTPEVIERLQVVIRPAIELQFSTIKTYLKQISNNVLAEWNLQFNDTNSDQLNTLITKMMMEYLKVKLLTETQTPSDSTIAPDSKV